MTLWIALASGTGLCIQVAILFRLQETFFPCRIRRFAAIISGMILYLAISLSCSYFLGRQGSYFLCSLLRQSLLILLLILSFRGDLWRRISLAAVLCVSYEFAANLFAEILSLFNMFLPAQWQMFSDLYLNLCYLLAAVFLWFTFRQMKLRPDFYSGQICRLLFFIMCGLLLLTDIVYHGITHGVIMISHLGAPEVFNPYISQILTHTECIILALLSLSMAMSLPAALSRIMQQTIAEQMQRAQIAHYQTLLEEHKKQISFRHDLNNHLLVLNRLAQQKELDKINEYLKAMCQESLPSTGTCRTGNTTVDALLSVKEQAVCAENISFTCELNLPEELPLEDFDLCILLGNLLDNAIRAASQISEPKDRRIVMQAKTVKRNLLLEIKNTVPQETKLRRFGTDQYGTGLHNVQNIIEKYHAAMDISPEDTCFCVSILLPLER